MAKKNKTICIVGRGSNQYIAEYDGSFYRPLIASRGKITEGKKVYQAAIAWLIDGEGCIIADEQFLKREPELITAIDIKPEDPVERVKRRAKERMALDFDKLKITQEIHQSPFPHPEPWVEPSDDLEL